MQLEHFGREIRLAIKNLILHKTRSLLTMLGMVFGVGSVVAMLAVGEGASMEALQQIKLLGSNNIIIQSIKPPDEGGNSKGRTFLSIYGLLYDDEARMLETFDRINRTVPVKAVRKEGRNGPRAVDLRIVGTTPAWFAVVKRELVAGRVLLPADVQRRSNVAVLTERAARLLLSDSPTIGQPIRIGGGFFTVVGIIRSEGGQSGALQTPDQENDIYLPLTTMREYFGDLIVQRSAGSRSREQVELHQIIVQVGEVEDVVATAEGIEAMLLQSHKKDDFQMKVPLALLRQAEKTKRTFNIVLGLSLIHISEPTRPAPLSRMPSSA